MRCYVLHEVKIVGPNDIYHLTAQESGTTACLDGGVLQHAPHVPGDANQKGTALFVIDADVPLPVDALAHTNDNLYITQGDVFHMITHMPDAALRATYIDDGGLSEGGKGGGGGAKGGGKGGDGGGRGEGGETGAVPLRKRLERLFHVLHKRPHSTVFDGSLDLGLGGSSLQHTGISNSPPADQAKPRQSAQLVAELDKIPSGLSDAEELVAGRAAIHTSIRVRNEHNDFLASKYNGSGFQRSSRSTPQDPSKPVDADRVDGIVAAVRAEASEEFAANPYGSLRSSGEEGGGRRRWRTAARIRRRGR